VTSPALTTLNLASENRLCLTLPVCEKIMLLMRLVITGGTSGSGKTAIIVHIAKDGGLGKTLTFKVDCVVADEQRRLQRVGIGCSEYLSGRYCPDHFFMENLEQMWNSGISLGVETLILETAGLCTRCAPFLKNHVALCVLDCTSGISAPSKIGPILEDADICAITKGDLVSQPEREVLFAKVKQRNPNANVFFVNGRTGEGTYKLSKAIFDLMSQKKGEGFAMRTPLPQLYCSYCLLRDEVGIDSL
jgi:Ni2+-binding GTPase involved in maturation of urease and hydrogenase